MGSFIRDLQRDAGDEGVRVHSVLLKARILASRLDHSEFGTWIGRELNGYDDDEPPPDYRRGIPRILMGSFVGPFGKMASNVQIPDSGLPEGMNATTTFDCRQPLSIVEGYASHHESNLRQNMSLDFARFVHVFEGMNCIELWSIEPRLAYRKILDAVRQRVLEYSIEIERANPKAGDASPGDHPVAEEILRHLQQTVILGNNNVVATAGRDSIMSVATLPVGDRSALEAELRRLGVPAGALVDLERALKADKAVGTKKVLGEGAKAWIGQMAVHAADGTWQATGNGIQLITGLLMRHLGLS